MTPLSFAAMGTEWWVAGARDPAGVRALVEDWEARLSRFRPDSALSRLNRTRWVDDQVLSEVVRHAMQARDATDGAFDPTLGLELAALGYDRDFRSIRGPAPVARAEPSGARLEAVIDGTTVTLLGNGFLDLGGIAKGWAVDRLYEVLHDGAAGAVLVDGGGDLRGWGCVGAPGGAAIRCAGHGVATSSVTERRWEDEVGRRCHHLLDPATRRPLDGSLETATVRAGTAREADVWAKAVLVRPSWLQHLGALGMAARVVDRDGAAWVTPGWEEA